MSNPIERTPFQQISYTEWAAQHRERLQLNELNVGGRYLMLSRIDAPVTSTSRQQVEAGVSRVQLTDFDPSIQSTIYHERGWHTLKAVFLTDDDAHYSHVQGVIDRQSDFFPSRSETPALETLDFVIGDLAQSYFLSPSNSRLQSLHAPRERHEQRHPDSALVSI